jgi:hypothetical protein
MANNRVYIVTKEEHPSRILLAKYYPTTGWYMFHDQEAIDDWLEKYCSDGTAYGKTNFELEFETTSEDS